MSRILLAEDEPTIAKLIEFKISKDGHDVTIARDGLQAMKCIDTEAWDLIILDVMMPGKTGWEVLQSLRARAEFIAIPVIMLTAKGREEDRHHAAQLGATDFIRKPFDPAELSQLVARWLHQDG